MDDLHRDETDNQNSKVHHVERAWFLRDVETDAAQVVWRCLTTCSLRRVCGVVKCRNDVPGYELGHAGDERINLKEHVDRMVEGHNDTEYTMEI